MARQLNTLAIDLGDHSIAAAVASTQGNGTTQVSSFPLGTYGDTAAAAAFACGDGTFAFGDDAVRQGRGEPDRLARSFVQRVGDDTPFSLGRRGIAAATLFARTVAWVVDCYAAATGGPPGDVVVTVPAAWGAHRRAAVVDAMKQAGLGSAELVTDLEAAVAQHTANGAPDHDALIAVYDLGGSRFTASVVRRFVDGEIEVLSTRTADIGGGDFDRAVMRHVISVTGLDVTGDGAREALWDLQKASVDAKESLSFSADVTIPVAAEYRSSVRLTRTEFEAAVAPAVQRTTDVLGEAIEAAGLAPADIEGILLVGGSSRIPFVAQALSEEFDRRLFVDPDPSATIARGAARHALPETAGADALDDEDPMALLADDEGAAAVVGGDAAPVGATRRRFAGATGALVLASAALLIAGAGVVFAATTPILDDHTDGRLVDTASALDDSSDLGLSSFGADAPNGVRLPWAITVAEKKARESAKDTSSQWRQSSRMLSPMSSPSSRDDALDRSKPAVRSTVSGKTPGSSTYSSGSGTVASGTSPGTPAPSEPSTPSTPVVVVSDPSPEPSDPSPSPSPSDPSPSPSDPSTAPSDPSPSPSDPSTAPSDPSPEPTDPAPSPSDPEPAPSDPAPAPSDPDPAPSDPAPAPSDPDPAPSDPAPAPSDPAPSPTDPAEPGSIATE